MATSEVITVDLDGDQYARYYMSKRRPPEKDHYVFDVEAALKEETWFGRDITHRRETRRNLREEEVEDAMWEVHDGAIADRSHLRARLKENVRKFHPKEDL